ncbi:small peptidoglycan-associated lipoprotein [Anaerobacillus sp. MEB173]|uniref:thioredoxin domain-containing protein n=1 Tax=Anaerobacillus sp. MEB173 TaxID=3383345 RepID=UPI003F8E061E
MKQHFCLLIFTSLFLTSGCWANASIESASYFSMDEQVVTVLFSDELYIQDEGNYYDALLDFNNKFPNFISSIHIVLSDEKDLIRHFEISDYPTLLIIDENDVKARIEGPQSTNEILGELEEALQIYAN